MKITLNQPYSFTQLGGRANQEDARFPDEDRPQGCAPFFLVCDGVGGSEKGEVASHTVCAAFAKALVGTDWSEDFSTEAFQAALGYAYKQMDKASTPENAGMATTLTFVCFHAGGCLAAHMGDSRIYQVRPGAGILYRSDDHSLVNALVHSGNLTPEAAENYPNSNVITRYIAAPGAGGERLEATVVRIDDICAGDYFFLCSDGVLERVSDEQLVDILSSPDSDEEKAARLADMSRDSNDNNTAYLIPIAAVEGDDVSDGNVTDDTSEGPSTLNFSRRPTQALDVSSASDVSLGSRVKGFFKKLFR